MRIGVRTFQAQVHVWVFSTLNASVIRSLLGHVISSSTPVFLMTSTSNMMRASKAKAAGKKSQGEAAKPQGPGRHNAFSGVKLEFLESFQDQFLNSKDRDGFYTLVTKVFTQRFGFGLAIQDNPEVDDANDKHTPEGIDPLLPVAEQNIESDRRNKLYHELYKVSHSLHKCDTRT